jgi:hypothetical protein
MPSSVLRHAIVDELFQDDSEVSGQGLVPMCLKKPVDLDAQYLAKIGVSHRVLLRWVAAIRCGRALPTMSSPTIRLGSYSPDGRHERDRGDGLHTSLSVPAQTVDVPENGSTLCSAMPP